MDTLKRLSVVTNNFKELKEKVLELTKNDFSWALATQNFILIVLKKKD